MIFLLLIIPVFVFAGYRFLLAEKLFTIHLLGNSYEIFYLDNLSLTVLVYITILSLIIISYARINFSREWNGKRTIFWFLMSIFSVISLVVSGNLLLFFLSFLAISLSLHKLLLSHPDREMSQRVADKKFIVSRFGDLNFILGLYFFYSSFGTFNIHEASQILQNMASQNQFDLLLWPALFISFACLVKSAQFPFHFWLPGTIDAPTPVSAIMHAGIINAGGFILVRLHFLFPMGGLVSGLILACGITTIFIGGISMLAQSDVKRKLAYSTIGQMGFMMVEFSLGLYPLVILHLMGHGFYKAYGFLSSSNRDLVPAPRFIAKLPGLTIAVILIFAPTLIYFVSQNFEYALLTLFLLSFMGFLPAHYKLLAFLAGILFISFYPFLIKIGPWLLEVDIAHSPDLNPFYLFTLLALSLQASLTISIPRLLHESWLQKIYCHSLRGFQQSVPYNKI